MNPIALTRHEENLEVSTSEQHKQPTVTVPLCEGCGIYHGSLTQELNCTRDALIAARRALVDAREATTAKHTSLQNQLQAARVEAAELRTELGSKE